MAVAYIAIGSNLGDRAAYVEAARKALASLPDASLLAFSPVYETAPVGPAGQEPFLNAAAAIDTVLSPVALLEHLRRIERDAGRERRERWGPRTLDLDLLLYDDQIIDQPGLTVPHPRMAERWFVLKPLSDIAANIVHPVIGKTIAAMLQAIAAPPPPQSIW